MSALAGLDIALWDLKGVIVYCLGKRFLTRDSPKTWSADIPTSWWQSA
jgi:hypothetical protein